MSIINISLPDTLQLYVEEQVAQGGFASVDEYFLDLIPQDQQRHAQEQLDTLLLEGLESLEQGESIQLTEEWWKEKCSQLRDKHCSGL